MFCPKCGYEQFCGCANCKDKLPPDKKPSVNLPDDRIACGNCGMAQNGNWWLELEMDILNHPLRRKEPSSTRFIKSVK